jgi:hypothetical protein
LGKEHPTVSSNRDRRFEMSRSKPSIVVADDDDDDGGVSQAAR